jgi:hypothetical protein
MSTQNHSIETKTENINSSLKIVHNRMDKNVKTHKLVTEEQMKEMKEYELDVMNLTKGKGLHSISNNITYEKCWNENRAAFYMDFFISKIKFLMQPVMNGENEMTGIVYFKMYGKKFKMNLYTYHKVMKTVIRMYMKTGGYRGMKDRIGMAIDMQNLKRANFSIKLPKVKIEKVPAGIFQAFCTFQ